MHAFSQYSISRSLVYGKYRKKIEVDPSKILNNILCVEYKVVWTNKGGHIHYTAVIQPAPLHPCPVSCILLWIRNCIIAFKFFF